MEKETYFNEEILPEVKKVIKDLMYSETRIRLVYGDVATGVNWLEDSCVEGRISQSRRPLPIPILVHNTRSMGGGAIHTQRILRITETKTKKVLYQHPNYTTPELTITECYQPSIGLRYNVEYRGRIYASFNTKKEAEKWIRRMQ